MDIQISSLNLNFDSMCCGVLYKKCSMNYKGSNFDLVGNTKIITSKY